MEAGYPDVDAERELVEGAKVMGEVPITGVRPSKFVPATTTLDSLKKESAMMKRKAFDIASSSGSDSNDAEVWQQTLTEVEQGWLRGPLDKSETDPITRRFGLQQGEKVHLIDDYSDSGVNSCVTIDAAAAVLSNWFNVKSQCNQDTDLLVRTFDLKSAYRQIGLHHEGREAAYVAVYCPVKKTSFFFQALVLPFGATRSVHSFLRLARSIWWLGVTLLSIIWTSFYDDYIVFNPPQLEKSTGSAVSSPLRLLRWIFATEGNKAAPFSPSCKALGIKFDLKASCTGFTELVNTEERVLGLCASLNEVIADGFISGAMARKLHGRMVFADAQLFDRTGKRCVQVLSRCSQRGKSWLDEDDCFFLKLFVDAAEWKT